MSVTTFELEWLQQLLVYMHVTIPLPISLHDDNMATIYNA